VADNTVSKVRTKLEATAEFSAVEKDQGQGWQVSSCPLPSCLSAIFFARMPSRRAKDPLKAMRLRGQLSALEYLAARRYAAAADRQAVTAPILHQTGEDGLAIVDAIVAGCSLSDIAGGVRERASYGWLLRRSLGALATALGYRS
jgi:hypothetical protein